MQEHERITLGIERLLTFGIQHDLLAAEDRPYCRNLLLDLFRLDAPAEGVSAPEECLNTATPILQELCDLAERAGLIGELQYERDLFSARIMGLITPSPAEVRARFRALEAAGKAQEATDAFYRMCCACDYIKVDAIGQNIRYMADSPVGELEITINLSKPEKDPKEIAKLKNAPSVGYPRCMLCVENPGYAGRSNFPARQNHRMVPLKLSGQDWYLQYSPYAYYPEHCIVLNSRHIPMKVDRGSFERLFSFVEQFPHYFLGSNADLPIVGGSILNHDHFQGGRHEFPMDRAGVRTPLSTGRAGVAAGILDWPMSCVELRGREPKPLIDEADRILQAWRGYSDEACEILAETEGNPHNTITPILRRRGDEYLLKLVLRNNRTSAEHPLGIFHPHAELHHIKKENIGLIEVMGLFILPGRLKQELHELEPFLTGERAMAEPPETDITAKHFPWVSGIVSRRGLCASREEAADVLRAEVAMVCARVLQDAGVYKADEAGQAGFLRFLASVGYTREDGVSRV